MTSRPPALLAVGHGSRRPGHAATVEQLLAAVRRRRPGLPVGAAFLELSEPGLDAAVARLADDGHRHVVTVPLLLGEAYHSRVDLPRQLAEASAGLGITVRQTPVLGPHPLLRATLAERLRAAGARPGTPGTAVVVAAAGSSDPSAVRTVEQVARDLEQAGWGPTLPAYASAAAPTPAEAVLALRERGARRVVVATYLLAPGRFSEELAGAGADAVAAPLGASPALAELVLQRFDQVARALPAAA